MSRFRRRLMGLAQLREAKRKDFVRVEYIENTSTAYIDTNIQFNLSMEISSKFQNMDNTTSERDRRYFGCATTWKGYGLSVSENSIMLNEVIGWDDGIKTYNVSTPFEIHYKNKSVTVNNYTVNLNTKRGDSTEVPTMYLLAEHRTNAAAMSFLIGRLYYFKIYNASGTLIRDYIPMYQISKDTYGLWDRVENKFYTSPNGVKFTGGARVVEDANGNLYYIKNYISFAGGGKNQVSIGIKPNETDYYETKWYFAGSGRSNFMGARTKSNNNDYQCYGYSKALHITYDTGNIVNYSVTYTNKAYIFKTYFNKKTNQMYAAIYDANKHILAHNKVAKRSGTATYEFFIGKQAGLNNSYPPVNSRMYYFKYWRNHTLVRDMIPVQSVETGEYGFFDKVNLKIYYSSGSADFTGA